MDIRKAPRNERRAAVKYLEIERLKWPRELVQYTPNQMPQQVENRAGTMPTELWRSRDFLVQVYDMSPMMERLSVCRTAVNINGDWLEDIQWEELQRLKRECGRGDRDAVEIYPRDHDIVNVANMRHLWLFKVGSLPFAWRNKECR